MSGPATLTVERAHALNDAMVNLTMEALGLAKISTQQIALLKEASLIELAQVAGVVRADDDRKPADANGGLIFTVVMDDRMVAAIYAFLHCAIPPARTPDDLDDIIVVIRDTANVWFLVCGSRPVKLDDDGSAERPAPSPASPPASAPPAGEEGDLSEPTFTIRQQVNAVGQAIEDADEHLTAEECVDRLPALRAAYETLRRLAASETNVVDVQRPLSALP